VYGLLKYRCRSTRMYQMLNNLLLSMRRNFKGYEFGLFKNVRREKRNHQDQNSKPYSLVTFRNFEFQMHK